jgi:hypothetical protein
MQSHRVTPAVGLVAYLLASAPAAAADPPPDADDIDTYTVAPLHHADRLLLGVLQDTRRAFVRDRVVNSWGLAEYRDSNTTTFTRDVDVLPEGHRPENWAR